MDTDAQSPVKLSSQREGTDRYDFPDAVLQADQAQALLLTQTSILPDMTPLTIPRRGKAAHFPILMQRH
jgi:hypothetical protein